MNPKATQVLERAAKAPHCDLIVIGVLPKGAGLYIDWTGSTAASAIALLEAAKHEFVTELVKQYNTNQDVK